MNNSTRFNRTTTLRYSTPTHTVYTCTHAHKRTDGRQTLKLNAAYSIPPPRPPLYLPAARLGDGGGMLSPVLFGHPLLPPSVSVCRRIRLLPDRTGIIVVQMTARIRQHLFNITRMNTFRLIPQLYAATSFIRWIHELISPRYHVNIFKFESF